MSNIVGTKGQIVIPKEIREQLGIKPGWRAVSRIVDGQVVTTFIPPRHRRSLKGILAPYITRSIPPGEEWEKAREQAWEDHVAERWGPPTSIRVKATSTKATNAEAKRPRQRKTAASPGR